MPQARVRHSPPSASGTQAAICPTPRRVRTPIYSPTSSPTPAQGARGPACWHRQGKQFPDPARNLSPPSPPTRPASALRSALASMRIVPHVSPQGVAQRTEAPGHAAARAGVRTRTHGGPPWWQVTRET
ncbi:hypothetical protein MAPG_00231 [Magnaporthiopsis poae ATCC 64411]|uniref:Uncharacterized protein n=1 Tax=Magnaporthiopsis poae (strain ATCC 64411 / 73-15) TaxID=644358 RepID=A0A0C4DKG0_MAGP6|nr:hypothetical protein MAPG_00231 [Magnaporthiopsis poae ATCC 64411]